MTDFNRRHLLRTATVGAAALTIAPFILTAEGQEKGKEKGKEKGAPAGPFTLPELPYAKAALVPHIDERTMEIHHDRHHATYVNNLNTAVAGLPNPNRPIAELLRDLDNVPMAVRTAVRNNGGGHYNHTLFWEVMAPNAGGQPAGDLLAAINRAFTDFDTFKARLKTAALGQFGSGWAWLVAGAGEGRPLSVVATPNQDNPIMTNAGTPILGIDVWEHAYYLQYQNRRNDYIDAWFNVINWRNVAERYGAARA